MQTRPTTTSGLSNEPMPRLLAQPGSAVRGLGLGLAAFLAVFLAWSAPLGLAPASALAGQIRESDLMVSSKVGKVSTSAQGDKVDAATSVHTIDIKRGSHTGEVQVTGQAGRVTTQAGGQNTSADSAVGGVTVGDNK